ncbi:hypothetical protein VD0004_g4906 [Verticillium dahliae]|nr:hypothetical protein VD0004_g4906 [Verticillium dahliae]PNH72680.1 hypothetical protein VD0001_g4860 [Verticillium dahliae]
MLMSATSVGKDSSGASSLSAISALKIHSRATRRSQRDCPIRRSLSEHCGNPGAGTVDGYSGDHIILAPPYTITDSDVDFLVETVTKLIHHFFHYKINLPEKSRDS